MCRFRCLSLLVGALSTLSLAVSCAGLGGARNVPVVESYREVEAVFTAYCTGCHNRDDLKGDLSLETHADILAGSEDGPVIEPGNAAASRLIALVERRQKPYMPPGRKKRPTASDIAKLRGWIDAGARE